MATWRGTSDRSISAGTGTDRGSGTGPNLAVPVAPYHRSVPGYDPDEEERPPLPDDEGGPVIGSRIEPAAEAALRVLDAITAALPGGGERRESQREMASAVAVAIARRSPLVVEAGTGVGKSLAYLVPAALAGRRVIVATATKNLQDQLIAQDAPAVAAAVPGLRVAILKGRANYLCRQRIEGQGAGQLSLDDEGPVPRGVASQLRRVLDWSRDTDTGDLDDAGFDVDPRVRRAVTVSPAECLGRAECPQGANCFTELARDAASDSDIVIVNAHLYVAHLATGGTILPEHDVLVVDEAHEFEDTVAALMGTSMTSARVRGVASGARGVAEAETALRLTTLAERLGDALARQVAGGRWSGLDADVDRLLEEAASVTATIVDQVRARGDLDPVRRRRALGPAQQLQSDLARLQARGPDEVVYLTSRERDVEITLALVDVGPRLADVLWGDVTPILTSATIPDRLPVALGIVGAEIRRLPSPFDYPQHALLYVPADFPERTDDRAEAAIIDELVTLITAAGGRTLALFTNRAVMGRVADAVGARLSTPVLVQGTLSRHRLIEAFRTRAEASLFAVASFWQGVDVPGHSLSLVTIDRLPFRVPNDPLEEARRARSSSPFRDVDLPRASMLLAQGVGRLIRSADDRGVVAVFDTRLATANYGGALRRHLPPMRRTRDRDEVVRFLREIDRSN